MSRPGNTRATTLHSGRVLIIDDEPAVGRTIKRLLSELHDVTVLTSGIQAIELLAGDHAFDVILCDLTMPEISGIEVYARAIEAHPEVSAKFVFMTGGTFTAQARKFLEAFPNARLDKPFDVETVRRLVRSRIPSR